MERGARFFFLSDRGEPLIHTLFSGTWLSRYKKPDIEQANSQGLVIERGADGKQNIYYAVTSKDWTALGDIRLL